MVGSPGRHVQVSAPPAGAHPGRRPDRLSSSCSSRCWTSTRPARPRSSATWSRPYACPTSPKPFTVTLPGFVHQFAPGHQIQLVVAGGSTNYRGGLICQRRQHHDRDDRSDAHPADRQVAPAQAARSSTPGTLAWVGWWHGPRAASEWRDEQRRAILAFARRSKRDGGGFGWLDNDGGLDADANLQLWITARMTYVFSLAHLAGEPDALELAEHGVRALATMFHDDAARRLVRRDRRQRRTGPDGKFCYEHAFVLLAACAASAAGADGADALLDEATLVHRTRFWDADAGRCREEWNRGLVRARRLSRRQQQHAQRRGLPLRRRRHRRRRLASTRAGDLRAHHRHPCAGAPVAHTGALRPRLDADAQLQRREAGRSVPARSARRPGTPSSGLG